MGRDGVACEGAHVVTHWIAVSILCVAASGAGVLAQEPASNAPVNANATATPGFKQRDQRYRIQPSDVLIIAFGFTKEFDQTVTVQPDGFVPLQGAGELKIVGLTVAEVTAAIIRKYSGILHDPIVTITLKEFTKPFFIVNGQVARPGRYELHGETSVSDAIAVAGGFNPGARDTEVLLFRRISSQVAEVKKIDLKYAFSKGNLQEDIQLQASDSIYVSKSKVGKIERFMQVTRLGMYFNPLPWSF